ncbi:MAG: TetR family transcriptional regulator [Desulfuromonadaceae bacterium]|nr:TetR family transcriptional regulator [Desulfuromonadaceae bacterium]
MSSMPKHLPAEERRAATIMAVVDLSARQNPSEITTAAIAKHMRLTQGALFRHFSGKAAIWESVMDWVAKRLAARIELAAQQATTSLEALEAMFMAHIDFVVSHPGVPRMMFGELQRADDSAAKKMVRVFIRRYESRLCALIEEGKSKGEFAPQIDTAAAATLFVGSIQGLVIQSMLVGEPGKMRDEARRVFALLQRALTPDGEV